MTGSGVTEASMPGRCAAPPAPAMITRSPRLSADEPYSIMSRGIRCADTTSASYGTANSASAPAAARMTGQSESLPMTIPDQEPGGPGARGHSPSSLPQRRKLAARRARSASSAGSGREP